MLSITQYEVYVRDHGRWTIHARYAGDQRKAAIMDARTTEFATGLPAKVVVETYFPDIGESELVTVYISPKARELREAANARRNERAPAASRPAAVASSSTAQTKPRRLAMRPGYGMRQIVMQGAVAGAFSLVAATISTVLISWGLKRSIEAGLPVNPAMSTTILTYTYAILAVFFFLSLFRSKLPLHRLLSYLWQQSATAPEKMEQTTKAIAAAIAPKLRPKRPLAAVEAEAARAQEQLKLLRGDPKPASESEITMNAPAPAALNAPVEAAPPVEIWNDAEKKRREKKRKEEEAAAAARAAAAEAAALAAVKAAEAAAAAKTAAAAKDAPPADALPLERAVLRRFISEVLRPATADTMPNDPVTRRGISLLIAGAAAALADTAKTSPERRIELVEDALTFFGVNEASVALFLRQHDELLAAPSNASLVNLGRSALSKHLDGADVARILASAIAGWRTPFGQPASSAPAAEIPVPAPVAAEQAAQDIYVLTELRMGPAFTPTEDGAEDTVEDAARDAARDAAMGLQNGIVRSVLGTHAGHEVKHTGAGIFARFKDAATAIDAAAEIQRRFTATYGPKLALAIIASTGAHDDPLVTPNLLRRAQTAAAEAADGEILAERRVQQAAAPAAMLQDGEGENDDTALVKISSEFGTEEPALYEHVSPAEVGAPPPQAVNAR